jgi:hypothetical protein
MRANKLTLHYMDMGVPIKGASILVVVVVGDNKTAVDADAATLPHSKLHKSQSQTSLDLDVIFPFSQVSNP